jgi:hypothetical protein
VIIAVAKSSFFHSTFLSLSPHTSPESIIPSPKQKWLSLFHTIQARQRRLKNLALASHSRPRQPPSLRWALRHRQYLIARKLAPTHHLTSLNRRRATILTSKSSRAVIPLYMCLIFPSSTGFRATHLDQPL